MQHIIFLNDIDINDGILFIDKHDYEDDYNHLVKSLRIKEKEKIKVDVSSSDFNKDKSFIAEVTGVTSDYIELKCIEELILINKYFNINLYQGTPKSDKLEFIIEKTTELGISNITPVNMKNSIKVLDASDTKKLDRFNKISYAASLQSMRHDVPKVKPAISYREMLEALKNDHYNILLYENEKNDDKLKELINRIKLDKDKVDSPININIIVGPEGGFSDEEIKEAKDHNIDTYSLGKLILRTETAPIVALSIINYSLC